MRIRTGNGASISVLPRGDGGLSIAQGPSYILLSAAELTSLLDIIDTIVTEHGGAR